MITTESSALGVRVAAIWAEVLQAPEPPCADANFFALGGDSLAMMMMLFRVSEEFGIDAAPVLLMDEPATLQGFCLRLAATLGSHAASGPHSSAESGTLGTS